MSPQSSAPAVQTWLEQRGGWMVVAMLCGAVLALAACGQFEARPDLRRTTLASPSDTATCVGGHKARQIGAIGVTGTPIVEITDEPCEVRRD